MSMTVNLVLSYVHFEKISASEIVKKCEKTAYEIVPASAVQQSPHDGPVPISNYT